MLNQSVETYLALITGLLLMGGGLAVAGGLRSLSRVRHQPYFKLRQRELRRGWRRLLCSAGMFIAAGLLTAFGRQGVQAIVPPTPTPTATPPFTATPTATPTPTITPTPSITSTPSQTLLPSQTPPPSNTPVPTVTLTPSLPRLFVTPLADLTVTPPADAVAANLRFSSRDNCAIATSTDQFNPTPKKIYAHFYYNNWLKDVQWSGVWYYNDHVRFVETLKWDGSTGGCGFTSFDNVGQPWPAGVYEVQIFIGEHWLLSRQFQVAEATATP